MGQFLGPETILYLIGKHSQFAIILSVNKQTFNISTVLTLIRWEGGGGAVRPLYEVIPPLNNNHYLNLNCIAKII
jgi:hypothetical protein